MNRKIVLAVVVIGVLYWLRTNGTSDVSMLPDELVRAFEIEHDPGLIAALDEAFGSNLS